MNRIDFVHQLLTFSHIAVEFKIENILQYGFLLNNIVQVFQALNKKKQQQQTYICVYFSHLANFQIIFLLHDR